MKKITFLLLFMAFVLALTVNGAAEYQRSTVDVPEDLKLPEGAIPKLRDAFFKTQDWEGQVRLVVTITRITNSDKMYDLLYEIATWDINNGVGTTNTSTHARIIAISNLGESRSPRFINGLLSMLSAERLLDTRREASYALSKIGTAAPDANKAVIVNRLIELINDPQKYNFQNFNRADRQNKFYEDDMVVESMVNTLGAIGDPKSFACLLNIVNVKNHREETIQAAWYAMKKLKWY